MFIESENCVQFLIIYDQNPANHVKEISEAATVRDVQNYTDEFYQPYA
jgi:hypothetical protein